MEHLWIEQYDTRDNFKMIIEMRNTWDTEETGWAMDWWRIAGFEFVLLLSLLLCVLEMEPSEKEKVIAKGEKNPNFKYP